jgi:glycosyltransferase involved in cell wall biosynthesis
MACNLPIVSVDAGDAAKIIKDIDGCYLCSRSPEDLAEKIASVLRTRRRTNGRAAAARMELSGPASEIALIYQELL